MKAEQVEGGWKLTGQKVWTSVAHVRRVGASASPAPTSEAPKHEGITYFLRRHEVAGRRRSGR